MLRILFLTQFFLLPEEGGGTKPWDLARSLVAAGHEVTVLCSDVHYLRENEHVAQKEENREGVNIIRVPATLSFRKNQWRRLIHYVYFAWNAFIKARSLQNCDLVFTSIQPIFTGPIGLLIARLKHVPFFLEVRDLWPDTAIALGLMRPGLVASFFSWLSRFLYRRADHIVALTPGIQCEITKAGIKSDRLDCIPNGYEDDLFQKDNYDAEAIRHDRGWSNSFVVVYAGSHTMGDNLETLLEAAFWLKDHDDVRIILIGDGNHKVNLQKYADEHQLTNVEFLPLQSKPALVSLLYAADVFVMCLHKGPHWGIFLQNKFFDYLAAGKPIVAALEGTQSDILAQTGSGIGVEPESPQALAEGILSLKNNPELVSEMGKRARATAQQQFSRQVLIKEYIQLIEEAAAKRRK